MNAFDFGKMRTLKMFLDPATGRITQKIQ